MTARADPVFAAPHGARSFDVVGLGQNSVDLLAVLNSFPRSNTKHRIEKFARLPGGQVASAMVCCARLGWRARYVGRFGSDEIGALGLASLTSEGVDVSATQQVDSPTRFAMVLVDARTGDRTVLWDRDPRLVIRPGDIGQDVWASARALHVDCEDIPAATEAARIARSNGALTVIDVEAVLPGVPALLRHIDIIVASEGLPEKLTGHHDTGTALAAMAREYGPAVACVTLGNAGSLAICQGRENPHARFRGARRRQHGRGRCLPWGAHQRLPARRGRCRCRGRPDLRDCRRGPQVPFAWRT
jgi:sugar/nucleoside kinase (ribokinase family)